MFRSQSLRARLAYVTLFAAVGAWAPFLPIYYSSLGVDLSVVALLGALMAGAGFVGSPIWGVIADRFRSSNLVLPAAASLAAVAGVLLAVVGWPVLVLLVAVFGVGLAGIGPVLDARAVEAVGDDRHRYGRFRVWGSASFVVSAIAVGALIERTGPRGLFLVVVPMLALTAVIGLGLRPRGAVVSLPRLTGVTAIVRSPVLGPFLLAILLSYASSSAVNAYFSIYLGQIGAPDSVVGFAWALGAIAEMPLMIGFPALARRFGADRLMVLGAACMAARALAVSAFPDPHLVTSTMLLHGAGVAFLTVGGVTYMARHAPAGTAATAQGVLTATVYGLAMIVGPALAGLLAGAFRLPVVFGILSVGGICAVGVLAWALTRGLHSDPSGFAREAPDPEPGTRPGV